MKPKPVESSTLGEAVTTTTSRPSSGRTFPAPTAERTALLHIRRRRNRPATTQLCKPGIRQALRGGTAGTRPGQAERLLRQANNIVQDDAPVWFFNYNKAVMPTAVIPGLFRTHGTGDPSP